MKLEIQATGNPRFPRFIILNDTGEVYDSTGFNKDRKKAVMHTVATGGTGSHLGLYRLETQVTAGNGRLKTSGLGSNSAAKEAIKVGFDYFKANAHRVSASMKPGDHDFHLHVVELHNTGPTNAMTLAAFVALCSGAFGKPIQQ